MGRELVKTWHDYVKSLKCPKTPYAIKIWGRVQMTKWIAVSTGFLWLISFKLDSIIRLVNAFR